jgi:hypothetical protein
MVIEKIYWSIGEVSKIVNEPVSCVRYWCTVMKMENKVIARRGRIFTKDQLGIIVKFSALSKTGEYTVKGIMMRL